MSRILFHLTHRDVHTLDVDLSRDEAAAWVKVRLECGLPFEVPDPSDERQVVVIPAASVYYAKVRDISE